jgi:cytochrome c biogenesis protein CcmG/thiol:disulfide interchange protein DsbE
MQKIVKTIIFLIFLFILSVFFIGLNRDTNYNTANQINKEIPDFKVSYLDKENLFTKNDLRKNNFTLINFWASWCAPCRIEHPVLIKLSKEKNIKIVGVNFKDKKEQAKNFLSELGNPYDVSTKDMNGKQSVLFGIYGIPESILINKELIVIKKFVGPLSLNDLNHIKEIIK